MNDSKIAVLETLRQKLDAGLGAKLVAKYRGLADAPDRPNEWDKDENRYKFIILGALLMETGAKIESHDLRHLRRLASQVRTNEGFTIVLGDLGFRGPSKRQFLVAVANYQPGTRRDFNTPSCHTCGKTRQDTAQAPLMCGGCKFAWFCNRVSRRAKRRRGCHSADD